MHPHVQFSLAMPLSMETNRPGQEKAIGGDNGNACGTGATIVEKLKSMAVETMTNVKKIGEDDPRRILHSMKVGVAITIVSMFYYFQPLYEGFGQAGMWAVLTVVVVFEYTVGGTLSKSINRGFATLVAGALGLGAEYLANLCGEKGEPVVLGILVFCLAAAATFLRFQPNVKRKYDYGVMIFILTFTFVAVSGYRIEQILRLAHQRLSTILIGGATCMIISIFVFPVWAGKDLHNLIAGNIEKLALFLESFGDEFLMFREDEIVKVSPRQEDKKVLQDYKTVFNSKANEESLANFAWWEPGHGPFRFKHPWRLYLKVGGLVRECAYLIQPLETCAYSIAQTKPHSDLHRKIQYLCLTMSLELGMSLRELASCIQNTTFPSPATTAHVENYKLSSDELKSLLGSSSLPVKVDLHEIMPLLVVASTLIDVANCVNKISPAVEELAGKAHFKKLDTTMEKRLQLQQILHLHRGTVKPLHNGLV